MKMAFEDRCCSPSPPPGIPHSPQNGNSFTTDPERSMSVSSIEHNERTSPAMLHVSVKEEHKSKDENVIVNQQTPTPITFSITNILSNSFGNKCSLRKIPNERKSSLFRPYDVEERHNAVRCASRQRSDNGTDDNDDEDVDDEEEEIVVADPEPIAKQINGAIDFSSNAARNIVLAAHHHHHQQQQQQHPLPPSPHHPHHPLIPHSLHPNAPIYPNFYSQNPYPTLTNSIYPRLHEEILNSQKKYQQYYQTTQLLSDSVLSKYPPLGNLCKTVSQIGQTAPVGVVTPNNNKIISPLAALSASQKKLNGRESVESTSTIASQSTQSNGMAKENGVAVAAATTTSTTKTPQSNSMDSGMESSDDTKSESGSTKDENGSQLWPAWIYCTRYSDRPSSGPRYRKPKQPKDKSTPEEKRPRTAFSNDQLARLKREFTENRYLNESRRHKLSADLGLNEAQIKIWFQNKRAKIKKSTGHKNPLAMQLMAQGLYNHSTVPLTKEEEELEMRMNRQL